MISILCVSFLFVPRPGYRVPLEDRDAYSSKTGLLKLHLSKVRLISGYSSRDTVLSHALAGRYSRGHP